DSRRNELRELAGVIKKPGPGGAVKPGVAQDAGAGALDLHRETVDRAPNAGPRGHVAWAPVVRGARTRPITVEPVHLRKISTTQLSVLDDIEPVAAAHIDRRGGRDLHRSLRAVELGTPHS